MLYAEDLEVKYFLLAVEKMRTFQRYYIQTRNKSTLIRCKELEREVDNYVEQLKAKI